MLINNRLSEHLLLMCKNASANSLADVFVTKLIKNVILGALYQKIKIECVLKFESGLFYALKIKFFGF